MRRSLAIRRKGEGYAEYALILSLMMVCTVSTFLTAGSESFRSIARSKQLCTMEKGGTSRECDNLIRRDTTGGATPPGTTPAAGTPPGSTPPGSNPAGPPPAGDPASPDASATDPSKDPAAPPLDPSDPAYQPPVDQPLTPVSEVPPWSQWLFGPSGPDSTMDYMLLAIGGLIGSLF
jgi:hypothetical protein